MPFDLDQLINNNFRQTLKSYLCVDSLENYDIKIEELFSQSKSCQLFNIYFKLTYNLSVLKNNLLAITVTSKTYNNQIFSLSNQNHLKILYTSNSIDFDTINNFNKTSTETEFKTYSVVIKNKEAVNQSNALKILLQLNKITSKIKTTSFLENYLIYYKINKNVRAWNDKLKDHLLDSYKEEISIPTREDTTYKQIENFKPYELTYKIFYQMAIRNENAKKIIYALNYLYDIHIMQKSQIIINSINCSIQNEEKIYTIIGTVNLKNTTSNKILIGINEYTFQCVESIDDNKFKIEVFVDKEINNLDLYLTIKPAKQQNNKSNIGLLPIVNVNLKIRSTTTGISEKNKKTTISVKVDKEKHSIFPNKDGSWILAFINSKEILTKEIILQKYKNYLNLEEHQIYLSSDLYFINELIKEFETELIEKYLIYPDNYEVSYPEKKDILFKIASNNSFDIQRLKKDSTYQHENRYFFKQDDYDGYSTHQGILKDEDSRYNLSTIKQDATQQVVDHNVSNFQINLKLPKNELISYLKKLKDNYDNDNSILMSPMELLGKEVGIEPDEIKRMNSVKWADVFYVYDTFKSRTYLQNKLEKDKNQLIKQLSNELKEYKKPGPKTAHQKKMIRAIEKKYEPELKQYESKIEEIGKTSQNKYFKISKPIILSEGTIQQYIKFMKINIEEEKYKNLL